MIKVQEVDDLTVRELKVELKKLGVERYSQLRKPELRKRLKAELRKRARKSPSPRKKLDLELTRRLARKSPSTVENYARARKAIGKRQSPSPRKRLLGKSPSNVENYARARKAIGKYPRRSPPMRRVNSPGLRYSMSPGIARKATLAETTYASLPKSRQYKRRQVAALKSEEGRGSPTRGWSGRSPQRGRERHDLLKKCGKKCFLEPKNEGYPVCAALRTGQGCDYDCGGIQSAYNRSRQYKNQTVATRAQRLLRKEKCSLIK